MRRSPYPTVLAFDRGEGTPPLLARGPLSAQLLWVLGEEPHPVPQLADQARELVSGSRDVLSGRGPAAVADGAARAPPPGLAGRGRALGVASRPGPAGRGDRGRPRADRPDTGRGPGPGHAGGRGRRAGRPGHPGALRRRPEPVQVHGPPRLPRRLRRVPGAPLDLPPQGGRPAHLGHPAAVGSGEGRPRRDPGRRVRRRPGRVDALRPLRRHHARSRAGRRLRPLPQRGAGDHARLGQHHDPVRPPPPTAGRGHRSPVRAGDDVLAPHAALRQRPAPARLRRTHHALLRRAHRGRRRARADRGARPRGPAGPGPARAGGATSSSVPRPPWPSTAWSPSTSARPGSAASPRCVRCRRTRTGSPRPSRAPPACRPAPRSRTSCPPAQRRAPSPRRPGRGWPWSTSCR